jgi:hypothetical protein
VARGRHILERAFGKENWQSKASMLRARYQRWKSLPPLERFIETHAENWGVTPERAEEIILERVRLASESRQTSREDQAPT